MSKTIEEVSNDEVSVDVQKREFMSKFGKYAAVSVGMAALMTPNASASFNSGCKPKKPRSKQCGSGGRDIKRSGSRDRRSSSRSSRGSRGDNPHKMRP